MCDFRAGVCSKHRYGNSGTVNCRAGNCGYLKIDVEGAEGAAMRGMLDIIDRCRPAVFSEFTPSAMPSMSHMTGEEYLRLFTDRGYRLRILTQHGLTDCGSDISMLMGEFQRAVLSHIDILCDPV